jgi:hypothetical protein
MTTPKRKRYLAIALLLLSPMAITDVSYAAGRVFYEGWETGNSDGFAADAGGKCPIVSVPVDGGAGPKAGTKMLQCNWDGSGGGDFFLALQLNGWSFNTDFFIRYWFRTASDMGGGEGPKVMRMGSDQGNGFHAGSFLACHTAPGSTYTGGFYTNVGWFIGSLPGGGHCQGPNWHQVEIFVHMAASGGVITLWVDDVMLVTATGDTRSENGEKWNRFNVSSNWSGAAGCCDHDSSNHTYWDEFEIYSDTGTGATGSMAAGTITQGGSGGDTTPPAAPTNLRIQ